MKSRYIRGRRGDVQQVRAVSRCDRRSHVCIRTYTCTTYKYRARLPVYIICGGGGGGDAFINGGGAARHRCYSRLRTPGDVYLNNVNSKTAYETTQNITAARTRYSNIKHRTSFLLLLL